MDGANQSYLFDFGEVEVCQEYVEIMKRPNGTALFNHLYWCQCSLNNKRNYVQIPFFRQTYFLETSIHARRNANIIELIKSYCCASLTQIVCKYNCLSRRLCRGLPEQTMCRTEQTHQLFRQHVGFLHWNTTNLPSSKNIRTLPSNSSKTNWKPDLVFLFQRVDHLNFLMQVKEDGGGEAATTPLHIGLGPFLDNHQMSVLRAFWGWMVFLFHILIVQGWSSFVLGGALGVAPTEQLAWFESRWISFFFFFSSSLHYDYIWYHMITVPVLKIKAQCLHRTALPNFNFGSRKMHFAMQQVLYCNIVNPFLCRNLHIHACSISRKGQQ